MKKLFGAISPIKKLKGVIFRVPFEGKENSGCIGFIADFHIRTNALRKYTVDNFVSSEIGEGEA